MAIGIGIDVYNTLVDPLYASLFLAPLVGQYAETLADLWRTKQLEYSYRRAMMKRYENFDVVTRQALVFAAESLSITLSDEELAEILEKYQNLPAYTDVVSGLRTLKGTGYTLVAFSNNVETTLRKILRGAGLLPLFDGIVSVDELKTFKSDPRVYLHFASRLGGSISDTWLVSANTFDVIGAKSAGLKATWIKRTANSVFDPWNIQPDFISQDLKGLAEQRF